MAGSASPPGAFQLVAIAASAGGLSALTAVLSKLPASFPVPVAVVQHVDPDHVSLVADILGRRSKLKVQQATEDQVLEAGTAYVAPPGLHMEIEAHGPSRTIKLARTEPVHFVRPSADRLFASAAASCGAIIGVVLTGTGSDGTTGAQAIKRAGGMVIAQDEETSAFFGMPRAAIEGGAVDMVLPLDEIAPALEDLVGAGSHDRS